MINEERAVVLMKTTLAFLLALMLVTLAGNVHALEQGTIILKSGEKYENVGYRIDKTYNIVRVDLEGKTRNFSFHQIDTILDSDGNDITSDILGTVGARTRETWHSENDEVVKQARARLWDASISLGGSFTFPLGDYYDGVSSGLGFGGDVAFTLTHNVALRFTVTRTGMDFDDTYRLISFDPGITILDQDMSLTAWRIQAAGQYYKYLDRDKDLSMYYVYTGLGVLSHKMSVEATFYDSYVDQTYSVEETATETKFATSFGAGLIMMLSPHWGIDGGAHFDVVFVGRVPDTDYSYLGNNIYYAYCFDLHVAVVALL
jgi:hypothetical protein